MRYSDYYHCKDCYWFEPSGSRYQKGYCQEIGCYCWDTEKSCDSHFKPLEGSTDCYITTIVCDILKFDDNHSVLQTLRTFRNEVMQKKDEYREMLYEYDSIGPQIATHIKNDYELSGSNELAVNLYNFYLLPVASAVENKDYSNAVQRYQEMTEDLRILYQIPKNLSVPKEYNQSLGGHGKIKTLGTHPSIRK